MKTVYDPAAGRELPSYRCNLCQDRRRISVPAEGVVWDTDNGCWFDLAHAHSVWCPDCETRLFNENAYPRYLYDFIAAWRKSRRGEQSVTPGERRRQIEEARRKISLARVPDEPTQQELEARKAALLAAGVETKGGAS